MELTDKTIEMIIQDDLYAEEITFKTPVKNILLVEGKTDKEMLERLMFMFREDANFQIIEMKGIANFGKFYYTFKDHPEVNIAFLTDNDYSAKRWIKNNEFADGKVITDSIYSKVNPQIQELEEYITNKAHFKRKANKKQMIKSVWDFRNICVDNVKHLFTEINNAFI